MLSFLGGCGGADQNQKSAIREGGPTIAEADAIPSLTFVTDLYGVSSLSKEDIWALTGCEVCSDFTTAYLRRLAVTKGSLPAVLLPSIREEIIKSDDLKLLLSFPGPLGDSLRDFLADDTELKKKIREKVSPIISSITGDKKLLSDMLPFSLDAFSAPVFNKSDSSDNLPSNFSIEEQAIKWGFIFSRPELWAKGGDVNSTGSQKNLQMLHVIKTLLEWNYLFGFYGSVEGIPFGGLTLKFDDNLNFGENSADLLSSYDPRIEESGTRLVSGTYFIDYPDKTALQLATEGGEIWSNQLPEISLAEQALSWIAAAQAFNKLRPANRSPVLDFSSFPKNTELLPLVFLPAMAALLDGPFINTETREIYDKVTEVSAKGFSGGQGADLKTEARLLRALYLWSREFSDLDDLSLTQEMKEKAAEGLPRLQKAIKFVIQSMLSSYSKRLQLSDGRTGLALMERGAGDFCSSLEAVSYLVEVEQNLFKSEFLEDELLKYYDWILDNFEQIIKFQSKPLSLEEALWTYRALKVFETAFPGSSLMVKVSRTKILLEDNLVVWSESFRAP